MVVMNASSIPKASSRIFAIGARQLVVQEAFETMRCSGRRSASLTPITIIASISSLDGTVRMTRRAPDCRCPSSFARVRSAPVDSMTISAPRAPQPIFAGSFSEVMRMRRPSTVIDSASVETLFPKAPMTVSYWSR